MVTNSIRKVRLLVKQNWFTFVLTSWHEINGRNNLKKKFSLNNTFLNVWHFNTIKQPKFNLREEGSQTNEVWIVFLPTVTLTDIVEKVRTKKHWDKNEHGIINNDMDVVNDFKII